MLYLSSTQSQALIVTLRDGLTIYPNYTWKIRNSMTNEETIFTQDDSSASPYYQSFTLSVSSPQGLTSGVIDVEAGQYQYFIYGSTTPYNLNIDGLEVLETGILNIVANDAPIDSNTNIGTINAYGKLSY